MSFTNAQATPFKVILKKAVNRIDNSQRLLVRLFSSISLSVNRTNSAIFWPPGPISKRVL
jgi:hypothetical protein